LNIIQRNITIVLIAFSIIAFIVFYLLSVKIFDNSNFYYILVEDANGLNESDIVYIENESLGKINKIDTARNGSGNILLKIKLNRNVNLPDRSTYHIIQGHDDNTRRIEIKLKASSGYFKNNDTIPLFISGLVADDYKESSIAKDTVGSNPDTVIIHREPEKVKEKVKPVVKENLVKPVIPQSNNNQIILKVQFLVSPKELPLDSKNFKGLNQVSFYRDKGLYKYVSGNENELSKAVDLCKVIKKQGFPDAFVVAFKGDERISMSEAKQLLKK